MQILVETIKKYCVVLLGLHSIFLGSQELSLNQIVVLENQGNILPIQHLDQTEFAIFSEDRVGKTVDRLGFYAKPIIYTQRTEKTKVIGLLNNQEAWYKLVEEVQAYQLIVITSNENVITAIRKSKSKVAALLYIPAWKIEAINKAIELIFGGQAATGKLSQSIGGYALGSGEVYLKTRLGFQVPENVGWSSSKIQQQVDSIMTAGIQQQAFPGAQLLVAKKGQIVFHKTYGFHTYDSITPVLHTDIYDLASVTKISAPLPALMKLYGEHQLNLDLPFSTYWKDWKSVKDKKQLTLREILAHQAGLKPYIIFLSHAMRKGKFKKRFLRTQKSKRFQQLAYPNIYVKNKFNKYVYKQIRKSEVDTLKKYRYSGLSFLIYPELISQLTGVTYETYLQKEFYQPLGAYTLGFNPENHHFSNALVPTEKDTFFRKTLTHKWVHDENAALLGGVSGNAGLFGSAYDLAKLLQMYLQKGSYGGKQYFSPEAIEEFTKIQYAENENRRGLGFDKPLINNYQLSLKEAYPAPEVSAESYGHAGFTGTFVWVDPKEDMVFVFLSNRVYPSRTHRKLYELNIRPALQQVFYRGKISDR